MLDLKQPHFFSKKGLTPYITLADPNLDFTEKLLIKLYQENLAAIEIGLPFSDPIADGPVIQASHHRALQNFPSLSVTHAFDLLKKTQSFKKVPVIFMTAVNLVFNYGIERFFKDAEKVGLDALILPDLNPEYADDYITLSKKYNIALIFLVSPLVTTQRLHKIVHASQGFVYLISRVGVTGEQGELAQDLAKKVKAIKEVKNIDVGIGFGISTLKQVEKVLEISDSAIVGSFLIKKIQEAKNKNENENEMISVAIKALRSLNHA